MVTVAKMMWDRRLTNAAGGNFAVKVAPDRMLVSPSLMSERKHCELDESDLLLVDFDMNVLEGTGKLSRESYMHKLILSNFDTIGCTIHAHPFWCMVYVVQAKPIPSVSEATVGRGDVGCIPYTQGVHEGAVGERVPLLRGAPGGGGEEAHRVHPSPSWGGGLGTGHLHGLQHA